MSGGTFDYKQFHITDIADSINNLIERNQENKEKHGFGLGEEALETMRVCELVVRLAGDLAHHADWRYAGDTGDETFIKQVHEAFEKFAAGKPRPEKNDLAERVEVIGAACGKSRRIKPRAIFVVHHDDPPCEARLTRRGYCEACKLYPDTQSKQLWYYCPDCDVPLREMSCPDCGTAYDKPGAIDET